MLQSPVNKIAEPKTTHSKFLATTNQPSRLYLNRTQIQEYFRKSPAMCDLESTSKQMRTDSNTDFEFSLTASPLHTENEPKKASIATNTEECGVLNPGPDYKKCAPPLPKQYLGVEEFKYFMFPTYGIREQSVQTPVISNQSFDMSDVLKEKVENQKLEEVQSCESKKTLHNLFRNVQLGVRRDSSVKLFSTAGSQNIVHRYDE